jgi:UDP-GlcNAc3NAcA epimerase
MKIVTVIGARPQFVKAAVVSREFGKNSIINELIIHTGQHYDKNMSEIFFEEMSIPTPNYRLNSGGNTHGVMTAEILKGVEAILINEKPDKVLVYGDTNSTLAGALAASKLHIPIAHIEAGLRSFNMKMPEEINRVITDRISAQLFCPTLTAVNNLNNEGFQNLSAEIILSGDVMFDAALYYSDMSKKKAKIFPSLQLASSFILATIHRQENTDDPDNLISIFKAFEEINSTTPIVIPIHPRTKKLIDTLRIKTSCTLVEPVGYFDMIELIKHSSLVLTDSGGLQKEAYFFRKPCVTLRNETEWVELVEQGCNKLSGSNYQSILDAVKHFQTSPSDMSKQLYGDGFAARKIISSLLN